MNNHNYHGNEEPTECSVCFSAMTESESGDLLICDNENCDYETEIK